ncbi:MAG: methanethiol S-methyltransferase [Planctomycetaceae bacterium]
MVSRVFVLVYGVVCYVLFLGAFLYAIGFVGNWIVPKSIDEGAPDNFITQYVADSEWIQKLFDTQLSKSVIPLLVNIGLLSLFAVQHSGMARPAFKRWWTRIVPQPIERSTYVLLTNLVLGILYWQWRPMPDLLWTFQGPMVVAALNSIAVVGWLIVLISTFLLDHFSLFGLKQTYYYYSGRELPQPGFRTPLFYRYVRHPLMLGFLIAFWSTPKMSFGHLLFSAMTTGYILVAIQLEERDLLNFHGDEYERYRQQTSMLLPIPKRPVD